MNLTKKAEELILSFEGMDQPARWPGASSGITLGHGFDLGYATLEQFKEAWERYLKPHHFEELKHALGKKGSAAAALAADYRGITISVPEADDVFERCTMPRWTVLTERTFPGIELLPEDAQGGLLCLAFNRGTDLVGERRIEMLNIHNRLKGLQAGAGEMSADALKAAVNSALADIGKQIRRMTRLWPLNTGTGRGLQRRRNAEAAFIEACITA